VGTAANLRTAKTGPATASPGDAIAWTITVSNAGPSNANGVVVRDTVPPPTTGVAAVADTGSCTVTGNDIACPVGTLTPGASARVAVTGTIPAETAVATMTNQARATSSTEELDPDDNAMSVVTQIGSSPIGPEGTVTPPTDGSSVSGWTGYLPRTGAPALPIAGLGALALGGGIVLAHRKRRRTDRR
jgi:uncharacterized repeat protein (TIGR01451 family)/LPXTG-motif cell wall-anchored protein